MFKYLPLIRLSYSLVLRPALKALVLKTDNDVDDHLLKILDHALSFKVPAPRNPK